MRKFRVPMKCLLAFFFLISLFPTFAQQTWKLKKDKNGVKVYSRKSESSFNHIKVEVDLKCTVDHLRSILADAEDYPEWVYATTISRRVKTISDNEFIYYSEIDVPWPASNRDAYSEAEIVISPSGDTLTMSTHVLPDYGKREKNKVRIPKSTSRWIVTAQPPNILHLDYILETDPGGNMPAWLVNLFFTKGPYASFRNLKEKCKD